MDNKLKIINYLGKNINQAFTMHELSKLTKIPYATFHRTIKKMKEIVNLKTAGKSTLVELNKDNPAIKSYLTISSEEYKMEYLKKYPLITKITKELNADETVLLFGSYAKGTEKASSDIDLLIINSQGNKSISFSRYEILFKKKINPIFITKNEFVKMLKEKEENVGKQALKDHVILSNPERFWEYVLNE